VTPDIARSHLEMESESLSKGEGKMMTAGLSNIYGRCITENKNYCFDCHKFFNVKKGE